MLTLKFLKTTAFVSIFMTSLSAFAGPPVYSLLKKSRPFLKLPHYTVEQKKNTLDQARLVLTQIYIHRELKAKDFGPETNPVPALNKIEKELATISDVNFHKSLSQIFNRFRDLHTLYYLPKPFACYESFLPLEFKDVRTADGKQVIAVSGARDDEDVLKFLPADFKKIKVGDIATSYNGMTLDAAIKEKMPNSLGANVSAAKRKSILNLRFYQHDLDMLPETDSIKLGLQNSDGEQFSVDVPWVTFTNWDCLATNQAPLQPLTQKLRPLKPQVKRVKNRGMAEGHTDEPSLYWHINRNQFGNFGYIQLTTFTPDVMTINEVVSTVKSIIVNELQDTDGLVFDLRGNPGGQLPLAERLIQLFSSREVQPTTFTLRNSPANVFYFNNVDPADPFTLALNDAQQAGSKFTKRLSINSFEDINDLGQVYFKPMAVFVDSDCYSACDTFTAQIQDHKAGTIFGEDATTGGGGANVYSLNEILGDFGDNSTGPFKALDRGQNMTFAFRQTFRAGINKGVLIEDAGIKVDRISAPAMTDLFNGTNDQLLVIHQYLKELSPKYTSNIHFANEDRQDFIINQKPAFKASWSDTTNLDFKIAGKKIESRKIQKTGTDQSLVLPEAISTGKITDGRVEILGSKAGVRAWRKIVNYRVVPVSKKIKDKQTLKIKLKDESEVAIYNHNTEKKNGWNISDDSLYLGNGTEYTNLSHTEASLFLTLPANAYEISFDASIKTEALLDFMKIVIVSEGKEIPSDKFSGDMPMNNYKIDLSQYAGKPIEIRFVFESDAATLDKGILIKNILLTPVL